jgi:hypothetical protein
VIEGVDTKPVLDLSRVARVERQLGFALPDSILATFAAGTELFSGQRNLVLETVETFIFESNDPTQPELIPVGRQGQGERLFCIDRDPEEPIFLWDIKPEKGSKRPNDFGNWLEWRINGWTEKLLMTGNEQQQQKAGRMPDPTAIAGFEPRLVD